MLCLKVLWPEKVKISKLHVHAPGSRSAHFQENALKKKTIWRIGMQFFRLNLYDILIIHVIWIKLHSLKMFTFVLILGLNLSKVFSAKNCYQISFIRPATSTRFPLGLISREMFRKNFQKQPPEVFCKKNCF